MSDNYKYEVKNAEKNKFEIKVEVTSEHFKKIKAETFKKLSKDVEIKGFRPGKAPKNLIEAKLGPTLYERTINEALPSVAMEILKKEGINPVAQLEYHLEKVSEDDGLHFHFHVEGIGKVEVPDLKKIKVEPEKVEVKDEEIDAVIKDMISREKQAAEAKAEDKSKSKKAKTEKKNEKKSQKEIEADDKWAESLGIDDVTNMESLRGKIKEQLETQKEQMSQEKYTAEIIDKAVELAEIDVPESLIEKDVENQEKNYKKRIEDLGLEFETFLKTKKVDMDELKDNWEQEAKKRISREILLVEIAKAQEIKVTPEDIDKEIAVIQDPKIKQQYSSDQGRNFIASVIIQQKAVQWLKDEVAK